MTLDEFTRLKMGDIVSHRSFPGVFVVTGNYGGRATAVRTVDMTNPSEWEFLFRPQENDNANPDAAS